MPKDERDKKLYKAPYHEFIDIKIGKLKQYIIKNNVDLEKILKEHDEKRRGFINPVQFDYIMTQFCKVEEEDLKIFENFFDPSGTKQINYRELIAILEDPARISQVPVREMDYILSKGLKKENSN